MLIQKNIIGVLCFQVNTVRQAERQFMSFLRSIIKDAFFCEVANMREKQFRYERKYYLSPDNAAILRQRVSCLLQRDRHSNGKYRISSLYFDDIYDTALHEKQSGVFTRDKWRMRWYNDQLDPIHLERKHKEGELGLKLHARVSEGQYHRLCAGDMSVAAGQKGDVWEAFYRLHCTNCLRPVTTVIYEREAFSYAPGNVRITFDSDLRASTPGSAVSVPICTDGLTILELKYDSFLPAVVEGLLSGTQFTQLSLSKYVMARHTLMNFGFA